MLVKEPRKRQREDRDEKVEEEQEGRKNVEKVKETRTKQATERKKIKDDKMDEFISMPDSSGFLYTERRGGTYREI